MLTEYTVVFVRMIKLSLIQSLISLNGNDFFIAFIGLMDHL